MVSRPRQDEVQTNGPRFFKIIVDPRSLCLRIPAEFMQIHGKNIRNPVFLRVPTGSKMEVELIRHDSNTWLGKGWSEFKDCYSIGFGHFLVFEYNVNSVFNVLIFDMSASEIEYPDFDEGTDAEVMDAYRSVPRREGFGSCSDDSVVFLEEFPTLNKRKVGKRNLKDDEGYDSTEILENRVMRAMKKRKRAKANGDTTELSDDCRMRKSDGGLRSLNDRSKKVPPRRVSFYLKGQILGPKFKKECSEGNGRQCSLDKVQVNGLIDKEKSMAYQRAKAFISYNPSHNPSHIALLQPSYVSNKFILNIPSNFAKENLPSQNNDLTLRVSDGKTWPIRCIFRATTVKFTSGWKAFVQDNGLKVGDACIFEMVKGSKLLWNVIMFRN